MTTIDMSQRSWFWKEDGSTGRWILDGRTKVNAKDTAKKRERKSIDWNIAQVGVCQTSDSRSSGGSGKEAL